MSASDESQSMYLPNDEFLTSLELSETQCILPMKIYDVHVNGSRKVKFHNTVRIRETIHINDYSDDEIRRSWYKKVELKRIREDLHRISYLIQTEELEDYECWRGLESRIGERADRRNKIISYAIRVVLWEQEQQSRKKIIDAFAIAKAYFPVSKLSAVMAHNIGLQDESETFGSCSDSSIESQRKFKKKNSQRIMKLTSGTQRMAKSYAWTIRRWELSH
jgi:hypothetical protein